MMSTWYKLLPEHVPWTAAQTKQSEIGHSPVTSKMALISQMLNLVSFTAILFQSKQILCCLKLYAYTLLFQFCTLDSSMTNSSEVDYLAIQPHKLLILDARSYAAAVANRAKGGGCECPGKNGESGQDFT